MPTRAISEKSIAQNQPLSLNGDREETWSDMGCQNFLRSSCQKVELVYIQSMSSADIQPEPRSTDSAVIELLRLQQSLEIGDLAAGLGVTATAVRQRLDRLMRSGLVERVSVAKPRGRPSHAYSLTEAGRRVGGDNFKDLALALWEEIWGIRDPEVRSGLIGRIGSALAARYRDRVSGQAPGERLESIAVLFREREVSCSVEHGSLPVLVTRSCPYPDLAEADRGICAAERLMIQELVGSPVQLADCRLDGPSACRFVAGPQTNHPCTPER
jgi:DeoR family transcriptional regulator, suf operon transcriptional repressor